MAETHSAISTGTPHTRESGRSTHTGFTWATRTLLTALLLALAESAWLSELSQPLAGATAAVLGAQLLLLSALAGSVTGGMRALAHRFSPRATPWYFAALALPFAAWAAFALLSGPAISQLRGVALLRVGLAAALVAAAGIAAWLWQAAETRFHPRFGKILGVLALGGCIFLSAVDTHFEVGLYPAFHLLLAAGILYSAAFGVCLLLPASLAASRVAGITALLLIVASPPITVLGWKSVPAMTLATYSNGLLPKFREVAVWALPDAAAEAPLPHVSAGGSDSEHFRLHPTRHPEIDALRTKARNVIFILVDGLRNDYVGKEHEGKSLTPFWELWQESAVRFTNAYSPSDRTSRSMPSLMTSYPLQVIDILADFRLPITTWIDVLRERGFRTFANGNCDRVNRAYPHVRVGFCFGVEEHSVGNFTSDAAVSEVLDFIREDRTRPFAVYTHWMDPHTGKIFKEAATRYREAVRTVDARLEKLVTGLASEKLLDETLLVLTADHGYYLGEDNRFLGNHGAVERQSRVPLILFLPGGAFGGKRVTENASGHDVAATILDLLAPDSGAVVGTQSLLPLLVDAESERKGNRHVVHNSNGDSQMLRRGAVKLLWDRHKETALAFDVQNDPNEKHPLADETEKTELLALLQQELARQRALSVALVKQGREDLPEPIIEALLKSRLSPADFAPVFRNFWNWPSSVRRFALETLLMREVHEVRDPLDRLAREEWSDDDQFLFVARLFTGSASACRELPRRYPTFSAEGRRIFSEMLGALPSACVQPLADPLTAEVLKFHETHPPLGSQEERFTALTATALAEILQRDTPRAIKEVLRDLFNEYEGPRERPTFSTLREPRFFNSHFLDALEVSLTEADFDLLPSLERGKLSGKFIPTALLALNTEKSRAYLLDWLRGESELRQMTYMLPRIREHADARFLAEADAVVQERFPNLRSLQQ